MRQQYRQALVQSAPVCNHLAGIEQVAQREIPLRRIALPEYLAGLLVSLHHHQRRRLQHLHPPVISFLRKEMIKVQDGTGMVPHRREHLPRSYPERRIFGVSQSSFFNNG